MLKQKQKKKQLQKKLYTTKHTTYNNPKIAKNTPFKYPLPFFPIVQDKHLNMLNPNCTKLISASNDKNNSVLLKNSTNAFQNSHIKCISHLL